MSFKEKWLEAVSKKDSVLCAGLDPAEFKMGRGDKGLPPSSSGSSVFKQRWALEYIKAVAPFCATIKPNINYWKSRGDSEALIEINELAHELGMVTIEDSKLADIGSTNDAGLFYASEKDFDAITFSPFAGNMEEAVNQAHNRDLGLINMCLMSNPEYKREKNKLIDISDEEDYQRFDIIDVNSVSHVRQYIQLAHDSKKYGLDGIVIGAPSLENHITEEEITDVRGYVGREMLVLLPGVGAQGGEASIIWRYFDPKNVIVNVGRALMFPNGLNSTPKQQAETAKQYRDMLNELRG